MGSAAHKGPLVILTLDINVVRDVIEPTRSGHEVATHLFECARLRSILMQVTSRLDVDVPDGPLRAQIDNLALLTPVRPGAPFRIGSSLIGGPDYIVSDEDVAEGSALEELLFPGASKDGKKHQNRLADIDHLMAHKASGAQVFVTSEKSMLNRAQRLASEHGINVLSPQAVVCQLECGGMGE